MRFFLRGGVADFCAQAVTPFVELADYTSRYQAWMAKLTAAYGRERAMELIVGGEYETIGQLEFAALVAAGLRPSDSVVDVGCGSGRLAYALRGFLRGRYVGTDILADALSYAAQKARRPDWSFVATRGTAIPVPDQSADWVSFFSVFTHLLDEDIFRYLVEAKRVLRDDGRIIFSYLDFDVPSHWTVFEQTLADANPDRVLNKFISKPAVRRWCAALGLCVEKLFEGYEPWITLPPPQPLGDAEEVRLVGFGQSVAILSLEK